MSHLPAPPALHVAVEPDLLQRQNVLLALDDVDRPLLSDRRLDLREPEEIPRDALEVPHPLAAVRRHLAPALAEPLGLEADDLIRKLAVLIGVVVRGDNRAAGTFGGFVPSLEETGRSS